MVTSPAAPEISSAYSLEDFMAHPPEGMEWVNGNLTEKNGMTFRHSEIQARLTYYWMNHVIATQDKGRVITEAPCRTLRQGRRPDVAYITAKLLEQFGEFVTLPQSFPLIAEIASPDDSAEDLLAKAKEYLESSCQEVWLVFPENRWVIVVTPEQQWIFTGNKVISTQAVLPGFRVPIDELLA